MDIVTLLEQLVNGLLEAEENFLSNPKDFYSLEKTVKSTTDATAAKFMEAVLNSMDELIYNDGYRKSKYNVQRTDQRTLISSVGDIQFNCTYYKKNDGQGGHVYLLEEILGLGKKERFTEEAEVIMLTEALKTSYSEAARALPSKTKITKTTVMNKVHKIADEIPYVSAEKKKECKYLFVEADEDHVAEQHGRHSPAEKNDGFISRLAYVYEYKRDTPGCKRRKELVNTFYFGGIYSGSDGVEKFWSNIGDYIEQTYDTDKIKRIYISGDGAQWIRSGAGYLDKALYCADKYHLMKYINIAAGQAPDKKDAARSRMWRLLYAKDKEAFRSYTERIRICADNEKAVTGLQTFVLGNWAAVMRTLHNKIISGCSAEGHISHVLSERLSSRPMGWSQTGADRMSKLRCYEKNYGREKIIDLVKFSREQRKMERTGTDDEIMEKVTLRQIRSEHYDQAKSYIQRIQATIPGLTVKKNASIRMQLRLI